MVDKPHFDPLFPAHAIERCAVTIAFRQPLPDRSFERATARAASEFARKGLQLSPVASFAMGINIDLASGKIGPATRAPPRSFTLPDQSATLLVFPNAIAWQNSRYVRWAPFIGQFEGIVSPVLSEFLEAGPPSAIKLEYWDRFIWSGDWSNFSALQLLRPESGAFAALAAKQARKEWHSHCGWFEPVEGLRRLINLNVDMVEISPNKPSVLIYSLVQDEPNVAGYGEIDPDALNADFVFSRLEAIHRDLKSLLAGVINDAMVQRINLLEGKT
jgi:uncharacterized protein (TIGR04255 family)